MVSKAPDNMSAFVIGNTLSLYETVWDSKAKTWSALTLRGAAGATFLFEPVTASRLTNEINVVLVNGDHTLVLKTFNGSSWTDTKLGGSAIFPPSVSRRGGGDIIDIFHVGRDHSIYHKYWDGSTLTPAGTGWQRVGGPFIQPPTSVSWGPNHVSVFGVGVNSELYQATWGGSPSVWTAFSSLGGVWTGHPKAVSDQSGNIDVFGLNATSQMNHISYTSSAWLPNAPMAGQWFSTPSVVSWGPDRIDIVVVGLDCRTYHAAFDQSQFPTGWESLLGVTDKDPKLVTHSSGNLTVLVAGESGYLYYRSLQPDGTWGPGPHWPSIGAITFSEAG